MGASSWHYFTPYTDDPNAALATLKQRVFSEGGYFKLDPSYKPTSINDILQANETEGTHSILDMTKGCIERGSGYFGALIQLSSEESLELLGTDTPTHDQVIAARDRLMDLRDRWVGTYLTVYEDGEPSEYFFTGFSGD